MSDVRANAEQIWDRFSRFEFMVAWRYLPPAAATGFQLLSVIAGLTLTGTSPRRGGADRRHHPPPPPLQFRDRLETARPQRAFPGLSASRQRFTDYDESAPQIQAASTGRLRPYLLVEGQALASGVRADATGVIVRGMSLASIEQLKLLHGGAILGHRDDWDTGNGVAT